MDAPDRKCALYRVIHRESGKDYVGISVNPERRWRRHKRDARLGHGFAFHAALRKHGPESFDWRILSYSSVKGCKILEKIAIHLGMGVYNLTSGGDGINDLPPEVELRRTLAHKAAVAAPEYRAAQRSRKLGVAASAEHRSAISKAMVGNQNMLGKTLPTEVRQKMSASRTGLPQSAEKRRKCSENAKRQWDGMTEEQRAAFAHSSWSKLTAEQKTARVQRMRSFRRTRG